MGIKNYKDLTVWSLGRGLVKEVYELTRAFPKEEMFGLTSQIRRAAVSIPSNIAEGHSRSGTKDYIHFVSISIGSLAELETQLLLGEDLGFVAAEKNQHILEKISDLQKMLHRLRVSLKSKLLPNAQCLMPNAKPEAADAV